MFFQKFVVRSWDGFWMPFGFQLASKIHQNPFKIHSQEAFKNWSILASIFERFALRFGSQVGTMLATFFAPRRPKRPPRRPQDAPTKLSRRPQRHQDALKRPQGAPRRLQDRFWVDFSSIFDGCLIDFWLIFHWFWSYFSCLFVEVKVGNWVVGLGMLGLP